MALLKGPARRTTRALHGWLGLGLGLVFVLLGLTGSLLVFYTELDAHLDPAFHGRPDALPLPRWQPVLDTLERAHPARRGGWRIELEPGARGFVTARYLRPPETEGAFFAPLMVTVDPGRGEVLASRFWGAFAATWVYDLHFTLLAGEPGLTVVGCVGLAFALVLATGLLLWWPRRGHWGAALRVKRGAGAARRHYDWHKTTGLAGGAVLLLLALSGFALALPQWVDPWLSSAPALPRPAAVPLPGRAPLPLDDLVARAVAHAPDGRPAWVDTPAAGSALVRVRLWRPGEPSRRFPRSFVWLHAQTGEVLAARDGRALPAGDRVLAWLHPLHSGEAFGLAGRVVVCLAGLLPAVLAVTGFLRWRDRPSARRAVSLSTPPQEAPR